MNQFILDILNANNNSQLSAIDWKIVHAENIGTITLKEMLTLKHQIKIAWH